MIVFKDNKNIKSIKLGVERYDVSWMDQYDFKLIDRYSKNGLYNGHDYDVILKKSIDLTIVYDRTIIKTDRLNCFQLLRFHNGYSCQVPSHRTSSDFINSKNGKEYLNLDGIDSLIVANSYGKYETFNISNKLLSPHKYFKDEIKCIDFSTDHRYYGINFQNVINGIKVILKDDEYTQYKINIRKKKLELL